MRKNRNKKAASPCLLCQNCWHYCLAPDTVALRIVAADYRVAILLQLAQRYKVTGSLGGDVIISCGRGTVTIIRAKCVVRAIVVD